MIRDRFLRRALRRQMVTIVRPGDTLLLAVPHANVGAEAAQAAVVRLEESMPGVAVLIGEGIPNHVVYRPKVVA